METGATDLLLCLGPPLAAQLPDEPHLRPLVRCVNESRRVAEDALRVDRAHVAPALDLAGRALLGAYLIGDAAGDEPLAGLEQPQLERRPRVCDSEELSELDDFLLREPQSE